MTKDKIWTLPSAIAMAADQAMHCKVDFEYLDNSPLKLNERLEEIAKNFIRRLSLTYGEVPGKRTTEIFTWVAACIILERLYDWRKLND